MDREKIRAEKEITCLSRKKNQQKLLKKTRDKEEDKVERGRQLSARQKGAE